MPFITNYNLARIAEGYQVDLSTAGELYKKPIYFFNKAEKEKLLKIKELLKINEDKGIRAFAKIERDTDTQSLVFEGGSPAYHDLINCPTLNAEYLNFPIPQKVKEENRIGEFRKWFKANMHFVLSGNEIIFRKRLAEEFDVELKGKIQIANSGPTNFEDLTLDELEARIDAILLDAASFYKKSSGTEQKVISKYGARAFLYNSKYEIKDNDTGMHVDELRAFLYSYDTKFKTPLKDLLKKYYMVKYNPNLEFKGSLLEQIGFKKCSKCVKDVNLFINEIF